MARRTRTKAPTRNRPTGALTLPFTPQSIFSDDRIDAIHAMALRLLQEQGLRILLPEAVALLAKAGAVVQDDMVRFGADMVETALSAAPKRYVMKAPNPAHDLELALGRMAFSPGGGCPNVTDRLRGRRPGSLAAYREALMLTQAMPAIHKNSPSPEPQDIPTTLRHYALMQAQVSTSDKAIAVYARGRAQVEQNFEMVRIALALDDTTFSADPWCSTVINTNSPRMIDQPMAQGLIDFARAGQLSIITPFCLAGAMAPITVIGALVLQHAEVLGALTLAQIAKPGAPVMYGGFGSNVDMKSGSPAFGTPTHLQMAMGTGQLARKLGLPWRSAMGAVSATNDMQAAQETTMALWGAVMGGASLVLHSAGWLEGGLTFGFEKFMADCEVLDAIADMCAPLEDTEAGMGWDALTTVAPGGHFFDTAHTMERYRTAFHEPRLYDLSNHGTWEANGALTIEERATERWQKIVANHIPPDGALERTARLAQPVAVWTAAGGAPVLD